MIVSTHLMIEPQVVGRRSFDLRPPPPGRADKRVVEIWSLSIKFASAADGDYGDNSWVRLSAGVFLEKQASWMVDLPTARVFWS